MNNKSENKQNIVPEGELYGKEKIGKILLKIAPPVMLAQLIQALYNIVDSLFVGKYSESGLTALSIIYPMQLLMIALGVGTGVGINTNMAYYLGIKKKGKADENAGIGTPLALVLWILFAVICFFYYAGVCENVYRFERSHKICSDIWANCVRGKYRIIS